MTALATQHQAPILDRLDAALADLEKRWQSRRRPKAFYLVPEDWAAFMATNPPTQRFPFGNNPTVYRDEPAHHGVPVRQCIGKAAASRLYDHSSSGRAVP